MGWDGFEISIMVRLDAHGGDKEEEDKERYEEFKAELNELIAKYDDIVDHA